MEIKPDDDAALPCSESLGRKVLLSSLSGVCIYDPKQGIHVFINPEYTRLTGYSLNDLMALGREEFLALFHPEDQPRIAAHQQRALRAEDGEILEIDFRFKAADGRWIRCISRDTVLERETDGSVRLIVGMVLDITERRPAEDAVMGFHDRMNETLRERTLQLQDRIRKLESEIAERQKTQTRLHHLSRVFRDAADPILIEDLSGTIIEMNREAERSYGWRREELIGKSIKSLLLPERYQFAWKLRERCLNGQEVRNWEGLRVDKYGRAFPVLVTAFPLMDEHGNIESLATITKDISLQKKMESELRESQRRLQKLSLKSIEALEVDRKTVSRELHDSIGGNLAAIRFALEAVVKMIAKKSESAKPSLEKAISHLAETIKECKRLSMNLRPAVLDDMGLVSTIDWHARQLAQHYSRIQIIQQINVEEPEIPEAFKIVIYRVIQEALNNAARHSTADRVYIRLKKSGQNLETEVEDNGQGFDLEQVYAREDHLSGLGLKSMQERVEIIGGSFSVHSGPGIGTRVHITLPLAEDPTTGS
jgi:PAS domain S-box-containing protein